MTQRLTRVSIAAAVIFGLVATLPAPVQSSLMLAQPDTRPVPSDAALDVQKVGWDAQSEFQVAKSDQDRAKIQQVVAKNMESVVRHNRLSVRCYQQIAMGARIDKQAHQKISALLQLQQDDK
ncbi:MAG: DUF4168 domain-containing protein [Nevskiaceae bacterium]|nr:MAG: DUF4168 domain-containing protein [Nevskiaceae bacterium]TBR72012.1 MAG: DUF4168 domain-containing protein [Nevskiaceae bacterium]